MIEPRRSSEMGRKQNLDFLSQRVLTDATAELRQLPRRLSIVVETNFLKKLRAAQMPSFFHSI